VRLSYGADELVCAWVSMQLFGSPDRFKECKGIGVIRNNLPIAGVVYSGYSPGHSIEMSVASIDKRWCNRHNLKAFFEYPFIQLGLERVWTQCSAKNEGVIMFNKRLGFTPEGYHKRGWPLGGDSITCGMLKEDCKWIGDKNGK
jgi:RimJ/RimL family protein N-acetyltransferase